MSKDSTEKFFQKVQEDIEYFRKEFDLTYAELLGALELIKADIIKEIQEK